MSMSDRLRELREAAAPKAPCKAPQRRAPALGEAAAASVGRVRDAAFISWCHKTYGCLVARHGGCRGRLTFHHLKTTPGAPKDDRLGIMICGGHHLHGAGPDAIEHGLERFEKMFGVDVFAEARKMQQGYIAASGKFKEPL